MMFITRTAQQLLLPWALAFWLVVAGVLINLFRFDVVITGAAFLILLLMCTNLVFAWVSLPDGPHHYPISVVIKGYLLTNIIMLATGLSYPFFRQGSSYQRVKIPTPRVDTPLEAEPSFYATRYALRPLGLRHRSEGE